MNTHGAENLKLKHYVFLIWALDGDEVNFTLRLLFPRGKNLRYLLS